MINRAHKFLIDIAQDLHLELLVDLLQMTLELLYLELLVELLLIQHVYPLDVMSVLSSVVLIKH